MPRTFQFIFLLACLLPGCGDDTSQPPPPDVTPPAAIESLRLVSSVSDTVTLRWTAPGDDGGDGQASKYEVRYSVELISNANWDSAAVAVSPPAPKRAGQGETFGIADLAPGIWYLALKAADEVSNWSAISNVIAATVVGDVPPSAVTDLEVVSGMSRPPLKVGDGPRTRTSTRQPSRCLHLGV